MQNKIRFLSAFLVLQLILSAAVLLDNKKFQAFEADEMLLNLASGEVDKVDRIEIHEQDATSQETGKMLVLLRKDQQWLLPALDDFPASQSSVANLLGKLTAMKRGWPVAETDSAASRFRVEEQRFERKIILYTGDQKSAELYLGTSPGYRKVHARLAGEKPIYAVTFNNFEAGTKAGEWVDSTVLHIKPEEIQRIQLPDVSLQRNGDQLVIEKLDLAETPVQDQVDKLVKYVSEIDIQTALGKQEKPEYNLDSPLFQFAIELTSGGKRDYSVSKLNDSADYVLKSSGQAHYFKVAPWVINPIKAIDRASLTTSAEKSDA